MLVVMNCDFKVTICLKYIISQIDTFSLDDLKSFVEQATAQNSDEVSIIGDEILKETEFRKFFMVYSMLADV